MPTTDHDEPPETGETGQSPETGETGETGTLASRRRAAAGVRRRQRPDPKRLAKRYGPILAVAALAVAAFVVLGRDGNGDGTGTAGGGPGPAAGWPAAPADPDALVRSGPMTPERAELENASVDFGPRCDVNLGRITLPTVYAPPCVAPFDGDNGGETSTGVGAGTVKVVAYIADPDVDPLASGMIGSTGADLDPQRQAETLAGYVDLYNQVFETYDRRIELETYTGTGAGDDEQAAKADAIAIAEKEPFAVVGGPSQASPAFADELAARGVICLDGCAVGLGRDFLVDHAPYVWMTGTPDEASRLTAEVVASLAGPGPATMAGDAETRERDRVYAVVHYDTPDGLQRAAFETLRDQLAAHDIDLAADVEFFLDPGRVQETARTVISRLEAVGVTTVIYTGDPLTPTSLTAEASDQDYHPEWILGPNYLADSSLFARTYDPDQWSHGFAAAFGATPVSEEISATNQLYEWAYDMPPPSNIAGVLEPPLRSLFIGVHLAGPRLTPETFRDGLLRYPPSGGGPTRPLISYDYMRPGTLGLMWWDPDMQGTTASGVEGKGMYVFANGGKRYAADELPESLEDAGMFDAESAVVQYDALPPDDRSPAYPAP